MRLILGLPSILKIVSSLSLTDAISDIPGDASAVVDGEIERLEGDAVVGQSGDRRTLLLHASLDRTTIRILVLQTDELHDGTVIQDILKSACQYSAIRSSVRLFARIAPSTFSLVMHSVLALLARSLTRS